MCEGQFIPVPRGYYGNSPVNVTEGSIAKAVSEEDIFVCLNDNEQISEQEFYELRKYCKRMLNQKFFDKSSFEKE